MFYLLLFIYKNFKALKFNFYDFIIKKDYLKKLYKLKIKNIFKLLILNKNIIDLII